MKFGDWLRLFRRDAADLEVERLLNAPVVIAPIDQQQPARWGRWMLLVGLGGFLLWALFVPLSQGVPAPGVIKVEGNRKTIQHLRGGIVDEILVKEGERVAKDQALLRLSPTQFSTQMNIVESQLVTVSAVESRLLAERDGLSSIRFAGFLNERRDQLSVQEAMQAQKELFSARRTSLYGEERIGQEVIAGLEAQISGLASQLASKDRQLELYNRELASLRPLFEQGFVPRNRMFELERAVAYLEGGRGDDAANMARAQRQIAEVRLKILQSKEAFKKDVETQLTEIQARAADLRERMVAASDDLDRVVLKAPVAGVVVDLAIHTVGGVVQPGQKLMDIVPEGEGLVIEVRIPPHLIDNVRTGLEADVHFSALDRTLVPTLPGTLTYVSADRMTDPRTEIAYYVARVAIDPVELARLGSEKIQPGMPADVVIKMNQHSMLAYLFQPLLKRMRFAMTER
ncbi:MAG: HlyD family type I secretion periplasmic adaptor subunit [Sterolibacterium sp.]|nr:HlyD family type I secretion periplasmic adaptor subunit [Sterolibacterium sp.]